VILGGGVAVCCLFTFVGASRGNLYDSTAFLLYVQCAVTSEIIAQYNDIKLHICHMLFASFHFVVLFLFVCCISAYIYVCAFLYCHKLMNKDLHMMSYRRWQYWLQIQTSYISSSMMIRASDSSYMLDHAARYKFYVCMYVCNDVGMKSRGEHV